MIYDLKRSVDLRWLFDPVLHSYLDGHVMIIMIIMRTNLKSDDQTIIRWTTRWSCYDDYGYYYHDDNDNQVNDYLARAIDARSIDRLRTEHCKRFFLTFRDKEIEVISWVKLNEKSMTTPLFL